jgi:hypothetical protein
MMKPFKQNKKNSLVQEPLVAYKKKKKQVARKKAITQLLVTPKNNKSLVELKKRFDEMEEVVDVELLEDGEVIDDALLKQMERNLKGGYVSRDKVMAGLNKIINQK